MATSTNAELLDAVRQAQSLSRQARRRGSRARSPICCWSTAIRWTNINLVADPDKNFLVIMKDGQVYKNTAAEAELTNAGSSTQRARCRSEPVEAASCVGTQAVAEVPQRGLSCSGLPVPVNACALAASRGSGFCFAFCCSPGPASRSTFRICHGLAAARAGSRLRGVRDLGALGLSADRRMLPSSSRCSSAWSRGGSPSLRRTIAPGGRKWPSCRGRSSTATACASPAFATSTTAAGTTSRRATRNARSTLVT